ncbi:hypothetical protein [Desulfofustis glycolicus]|uniref:Zinc-ribbon domain-containing protein n=1 Tax=Desulfofustis glycolicus DSM 9705 TaxID=1121409 RepID=A0A1M5SG97_9BACT|nr:hypothetical protein [Desulfofustis glycolicus]SHH37485.1 hypothetical protein SAMN02745124_00333 [Desulfofustis glycolicus DSM 9705]
MNPDKKLQPEIAVLAGTTWVIDPKTPTPTHHLCAACGTQITPDHSLCAPCTTELMNQPPSWTATRL